MFFKRFELNTPRVVAKEPQAPSAHDIATDSRQTGAAIESMTQRALHEIRLAPIPASRQIQEPSEGAVIEALTRAAIPAVARDARLLQRVRADNQLAKQNAEAAQRRAIALQAIEL
jgi:hypothetical protein